MLYDKGRQGFLDGSINWAEGYEIIGAAVVAGGPIFATWMSRNKPKEN